MKKKLLTILGATSLFYSTIAQQQQPLMHPCGTVDAMEEAFKADPELKKKFEASQAQFEIEYQKALSNMNASKIAATIYTIPIVFHIMGPQAVTDQVIINFVDAVNRDYARLGSDTGSINPAFRNVYVDAGIRVALAKKDPTGKCTNGIIRHNSDSPDWSQNTPNYAYSGIGTNKWPTNQYLNVYIVSCIASTQYTCPVTTGAYLGGYTYRPGSAPSSAADAIVYLKSTLGQSNSTDSRVLSHEIGHWLNLLHTFGNSNNAYFGNAAAPAVNCGATILDDLVGDTPETKGYFSICPSTYSLDCTSLPNIENNMDYSSCRKMFTQGQVTRMRAAIVSSTAGRNNLWTTANYDATGLTGNYTCTPVADLKTNRTAVCEGQTVTYTNMSQVGTSGTLAWTFEGGNPSTSTATSVVVTYPVAGNYSVSLIATNSAGTNTLNKTSYIKVTNGASGVLVPNAHDFETVGLPTNITVINSNAGTIAWSQNATVGANSTAKSIYLNNASVSSGGNLDIFETPIYDFSNTTNVSLSFWYSYAKKIATQADTFKVQYSLDCGGVWTNVLAIPSLNTMATNTGGTTTTPLVPTTTQWKQASIVSGLLTALNSMPSVKFRFYFRSDAKSGSSNNIYIDEINLTGAVGINELEKLLKLNIYPNPTNSSSNVDFTITGNETIKISLTDIVGRTIEETSTPLVVNGKNVSHTVNKNGVLAKGIYIININVNNQRISKKLIIE